MDEIRIHGLSLECIVGINDHEREREQPLRVDLTMGLDTREAARTGKITRTVHYGDVAQQVAALLRFRRYRLLEGAAEEIAWMLLNVHPRLQWVKISVEKPKALEGLAAAASLTVTRSRGDWAEPEPEHSSSAEQGRGGVSRQVGMGEAQLSVLCLEPRQSWDAGEPALRGLVWVLGGTLCVGNQVLSSGQHVLHESATRLLLTGGPESARLFVCRTNQDCG